MTYRAFAWKDCGQPQATPVKIAGLRPEFSAWSSTVFAEDKLYFPSVSPGKCQVNTLLQVTIDSSSILLTYYPSLHAHSSLYHLSVKEANREIKTMRRSVSRQNYRPKILWRKDQHLSVLVYMTVCIMKSSFCWSIFWNIPQNWILGTYCVCYFGNKVLRKISNVEVI
jgi:hypothetical protein